MFCITWRIFKFLFFFALQNFVVSGAKLHVENSQFWNRLRDLYGNALVGTARMVCKWNNARTCVKTHVHAPAHHTRECSGAKRRMENSQFWNRLHDLYGNALVGTARMVCKVQIYVLIIAMPLDLIPNYMNAHSLNNKHIYIHSYQKKTFVQLVHVDLTSFRFLKSPCKKGYSE